MPPYPILDHEGRSKLQAGKESAMGKVRKSVVVSTVVLTVGAMTFSAGCCCRDRGGRGVAPGGETDDGRYTTGSSGGYGSGTKGAGDGSDSGAGLERGLGVAAPNDSGLTGGGR